MSWESIYNFFGIKDFIYFISSPDVQDMLFPIKLVFVICAMFFLAGVIYFMINSSFVKYRFLEDVTEFVSWQAYGLKEITKRWKKIMSKIGAGAESSYKLAIVEADDFLFELMQDREYPGDNFEEIIKAMDNKILSNIDKIREAHLVRNSIVYNSDYKLDTEYAKKILNEYESAVNTIGSA
ncbi:MAG: hypothetical protein AAB361_03310 [Patescibacteria group bacterium]